MYTYILKLYAANTVYVNVRTEFFTSSKITYKNFSISGVLIRKICEIFELKWNWNLLESKGTSKMAFGSSEVGFFGRWAAE